MDSIVYFLVLDPNLVIYNWGFCQGIHQNHKEEVRTIFNMISIKINSCTKWFFSVSFHYQFPRHLSSYARSGSRSTEEPKPIAGSFYILLEKKINRRGIFLS